MSNYDRFAEVYDRLMEDADYKTRTDYLLSLFEKHDRRPALLLDLACGTGGFSKEFAKRGIDVIGVDVSEYILADNTFVIDRDDVYCVWQNETDPETLETDILLDFFIRDGDAYRRSGEEFSERAYSDRQIDEAIISAGLKKVAVYADMTLSPPTDETERAIYVARKI